MSTHRYSIHRGPDSFTGLVDLSDHLGAAKRSASRNSKEEPGPFSVFDTQDNTCKAAYENGVPVAARECQSCEAFFVDARPTANVCDACAKSFVDIAKQRKTPNRRA